MVTPFPRLLPATLLLTTLLSASAKELPDYRVGDRIETDVVTPLPLMVVDPAATEALQEKESQRIPVLFRFDKSAAINVEADLREKYSLARSNFLFLMHSSFHHTQLEEDQIATEQFDKLIASFKKRDKTFPLTDQLATDWALGRDGLAEQLKVVARIRQTMEQPIRYDNLTNAPKMGSRITLILVKNPDERIGLDDVARGQSIAKTNLQTMSRARLALREMFSAEEEDAARFAVRCLVENCFVETELTLAARTRQTEALFVADNYQAGQTIARQGQLVDRKIMAVFSQLQEKTVAGRLQEQVAHQQGQVTEIRESNRLLIAGLIGVATLLCAALAWFAFRRKAPESLLPAVIHPGGNPAPTVDTEWQQRALAAEQQVAKAHEAIRSGVMAQLKDKAVTSLAAQRSDMLETQHAAAAEMAELEKRLNELHAPLQDRLRAYESRITDLEKALAAKGEENRELIRAKIELMRKQLEAERAKDVRFN